MTRLILFLLLFAAAVLAITAVLNMLSTAVAPFTSRGASKREDTMPATFRNVAYVLLLILMVGVATGWMGSV